MSERVPNATGWVPGRQVSNPEDLVRVLLLDVLVDNGDRHHGNVLLQPDTQGMHRFIAIDYDGAGIRSFAAERPQHPRHPTRPGDPFWLVEMKEEWLADGMTDAVASLNTLLGSTTNRLEALVYQALEAAHGSRPHDSTVQTVVDYLLWRAPAAQTMAEDYWKEARRGTL
jgi:hypothetical protein